jgi:hypothetical protein
MAYESIRSTSGRKERLVSRAILAVVLRRPNFDNFENKFWGNQDIQSENHKYIEEDVGSAFVFRGTGFRGCVNHTRF